jgi:hypothetical protein
MPANANTPATFLEEAQTKNGPKPIFAWMRNARPTVKRLKVNSFSLCGQRFRGRGGAQAAHFFRRQL